MLDDPEQQDVGVHALDVGRPVVRQVTDGAATRTRSASTIRAEVCRRRQRPRIIDAADVGRDDAGGAEVEHLRDGRGVVIHHPHHRVDVGGVSGSDQLTDLGEVQTAVLGVDPDEVVTGPADHLDDLRAG